MGVTASSGGAQSAPYESPATPTPSPTETLAAQVPGGPVAASGTALALLAAIPVRSTDTSSGYSRDQFGPAWEDMDHNGCDTRNDILARDLVDERVDGSCKVLSGVLVSAYTGATISFVRGTGTSTAVQIDHVVALSDAWRSGASGLTASQRETLANDPLNLQAIEGPLNASKSDDDASEWLPPLASYRCIYVARQVSVKYLYGLSVTSAEQSAIASVLAGCPAQPAFGSTLVLSRLAPSAVGGPVNSQSGGPVGGSAGGGSGAGEVSYVNCTAARAAGKAPIRIGEPGYSTRLDRDGDGIACE